MLQYYLCVKKAALLLINKIINTIELYVTFFFFYHFFHIESYNDQKQITTANSLDASFFKLISTVLLLLFMYYMFF